MSTRAMLIATAPGLGVRVLLVTALLLPVEFVVGDTALSLCFFWPPSCSSRGSCT